MRPVGLILFVLGVIGAWYTTSTPGSDTPLGFLSGFLGMTGFLAMIGVYEK